MICKPGKKIAPIVYFVLVLTVINIVLLYLTDLFTLKMVPGHGISGNGNPGIVLWFLEIPAYIALLICIFYITHKRRTFANGRLLYAILFLAVFAAAAYMQYRHANRIIAANGDRIQEFGAINQYTNTIYLNGYTFMIGISALLAATALVQRFNSKQTT